MTKHKILLSLIVVGLVSHALEARGDEPKPPPITAEKAGPCILKRLEGKLQPENGKSAVVYKTTQQGDLKINLYFPKDWKRHDHRPAIIFFFGGGFAFGDPSQFVQKCEYFASRGMVAAAPEFRIVSKHHTEKQVSLEDVKSAIRWLRVNARSLGIDPQRIVAGGGSSGAGAAVIAAYSEAFEPQGENLSVSSKPEALVLFYGGLGTFPPNPGYPWFSNYKVTPHGPPAIMFIGTEDKGITANRQFCELMIAAGNRAELYTAEGQKHGFCGPAPPTGGDNPWQDLVLEYTDRFLASLGYLKGAPTIAVPADKNVKLTREVPPQLAGR